MSGNDGEDSARSRRLKSSLRACDSCRTKKIRCDAGQVVNGSCSPCAEQGKTCSYQKGTRRRTAPKWYVEKMEDRMEKLEVLFKNLHPDVDIEAIVGPAMPRGGWEYAQPEHFSDAPVRTHFSLHSPPVTGINAEQERQNEEEESMKHIQRMVMKLRLADGRHYGPSSNSRFLRTAMDLMPGRVAEQWHHWFKKMDTKRRKSIWGPQPWEQRCLGGRPTVQYTFPPTDLIPTLIQQYFWRVNLFYPILHGPTFLAHYSNDLHERDSEFAALLIFVCAIGSRWCEDPRVREGNDPHSAGWKYFEQAWPTLLPSHEPASLTRLQGYCVALLFLMGGGKPQMMWMLVGVALHLCQDVGAHLKGTFKHRSLVDQELYRRVFWILFVYDATFSSSMGRLAIFSGQDFDVERPMEVDDEYWLNDDPELAWKQPHDKPSLVAFFNQVLDLVTILTKSRRALFPLGRNMPPQPNGPKSEEEVLINMDSALNRWLEHLPDHLRWNPQVEPSPLFIQTASLHVYFHQCTILAHREFIPTPSSPVRTTSPALAICTNAARSIARILGVLRGRDLEVGLTWFASSAFHAAVILLLNMWGAGGKGSGMGYASQLQDVHNCIWTVSNLEMRWPGAGKLRDVLEELASVGDFPLADEPSSSPNLKRPRSGQLGRADHDDDASGMPAGKTLRTSTTTSPLSFAQPSPYSLSPDGQSRVGMPPQMREQLGDELLPNMPLPVGPSSFQGDDPLLVHVGGPEWGSSPQQVFPFDTFHSGVTPGLTNDGIQSAEMGGTGSGDLGFLARDALELTTLNTLMQLWSHTPMGTGWELWDNLPTMPSMAEDISGSESLDAAADRLGGIFESGSYVNGGGA